MNEEKPMFQNSAPPKCGSCGSPTLFPINSCPDCPKDVLKQRRKDAAEMKRRTRSKVIFTDSEWPTPHA